MPQQRKPGWPKLTLAELEPIYSRRFERAQPDRFVSLWCELAHICGTSPTELHEDDMLRAGEPPRFLELDDSRMEDLFDFAMRNSRSTPKEDIRTVGDLIDFLLDDR